MVSYGFPTFQIPYLHPPGVPGCPGPDVARPPEIGHQGTAQGTAHVGRQVDLRPFLGVH